MIFHFPQRNVQSLPKLELNIEGTSIDQVTTFNFLGITISDDLTWKSHTNKIITKLNRSIGVIRRLQSFVPCTVLKTLYNSLILPHLQYGLLLWGNSPNNLFQLQKRAIRVVSKSKYISHSEPLFKSLGILKLKDMYNLQCIKFMHKYTTGSLPFYFCDWFKAEHKDHPYNMRKPQVPRLERPKHNILNRIPKYHIPNVVSALPTNIKDKINTHSLNGISKYTKMIILNNYSNSCFIDNCYVCSQSS